MHCQFLLWISICHFQHSAYRKPSGFLPLNSCFVIEKNNKKTLQTEIQFVIGLNCPDVPSHFHGSTGFDVVLVCVRDSFSNIVQSLDRHFRNARAFTNFPIERHSITEQIDLASAIHSLSLCLPFIRI